LPDMDAQVGVRYEMLGRVVSADGRVLEFKMDDSFASWWAITRWNWHYRHWAALRMNARDLFTKVLRRKLWRR
jgi:hypothetical protein